jgi:hypothetical protein
MRLRRAGLVSLIVALMAISGASVVSVRGADGRRTASIVWQARDEKPAPVARKIARPPIVARGAASPSATPSQAAALYAPVRHPLYQRPPPTQTRRI